MGAVEDVDLAIDACWCILNIAAVAAWKEKPEGDVNACLQQLQVSIATATPEAGSELNDKSKKQRYTDDDARSVALPTLQYGTMERTSRAFTHET